MPFPFIELAGLLLRNRTNTTRDHQDDLNSLADIASAHDKMQDARLTALEAKVETLSRSMELMIRARVGAKE